MTDDTHDESIAALGGGDAAARHRVLGWIAADPDVDSATDLLDQWNRDPDGVAASFEGRLTFGTAGLRGPIGPGPNKMNRVIVRIAAAAIADQLIAESRSGPIVVGFDARHGSRSFALDSARVFVAKGFEVVLIDGEVPTPVLAFHTLARNAVAGIMVTASHNPPGDNGYKVYWSDGAQITPPLDAEIEARMDRAPLLDDELANHVHVERLTPREAIDAYISKVILPHTGSPLADVSIVYTPLHGVGAAATRAAFDAAHLPRPIEVASQNVPDPDFSTVNLPNPEEAGALDEAFATADDHGADLVLAHDPDADRLGVAVRDGDRWRTLTGDEIGAILANRLLARSDAPDAVVASSIVSSPWIETIAAAHGAQSRRTLTGFKWIIRAAIDEPDSTYVFGYEEALGFACNIHVRDKDGLSAIVELAGLAGELAADGRTLLDHLDDLIKKFGVVRSAQVTRRYDDEPSEMTTRLDELRSETPESLDVRRVVDHLHHDPATNLLEWHIGEYGDRVLLRPSGTEPKLKAYLQVAGDSDQLDIVDERLELLVKHIDELL